MGKIDLEMEFFEDQAHAGRPLVWQEIKDRLITPLLQQVADDGQIIKRLQSLLKNAEDRAFASEKEQGVLSERLKKLGMALNELLEQFDIRPPVKKSLF